MMKTDYATGHPGYRTFYEVLGIPSRFVADRRAAGAMRAAGESEAASFPLLKKAYYHRAKECHPDLHPADPAKEAEFKLLVNAFDILSDPAKRRSYDEHLHAAKRHCRNLCTPEDAAPAVFVYDPKDIGTVMDTVADDILEELIVGNYVPKNATLQTLMRDLESTDKFIRFREGKNYLADGQYRLALETFQAAVRGGPGNILYHHSLGQAAEKLRQWALAERHYKICLKIGAARNPPQLLQRIRDALYYLRRDHCGLFGKLSNWLAGAPRGLPGDSEETMIQEVSRSMYRMLKKGQKKPPGKSPRDRKNRQLPPAPQ